MIIESEYIKIVEQLGLQSRLNKLKEEIFELGQSVCHFQDGKVKFGDITSEMADVSILFAQITHLVGCEKEIINCIDYKREKFYKMFIGELN